MGAIQTAIRHLKMLNIPNEILEIAFKDPKFVMDHRQRQNLPLDYLIRQEVINAIVLPDCDIVGGRWANIELTNVQYSYDNEYSRIYRVPKSSTGGASITSAYEVTWGIGLGMNTGGFGLSNQYGAAGMGGTCDRSEMGGEFGQIMQTYMPIANVSTARAYVINENVIGVYEHIVNSGPIWLRCMLTNDPELNNIHPTAWLAFAELVGWATKAYVYNQVNIRLDAGQLHAGYDLGVIRNLVDGYSDANQNYLDMLKTKWRRISILNDPLQKQRHMQLLGPGIL